MSRAGPDLPFGTTEAAALETALRRGRQGRGIQAPSLRPPIPFKPTGRASLGGMTTGGPGLRRSRTLLCNVLSLNGRASPDHKLAKRDRSTSPSSVCARKRELRPAARQRSTATCYKSDTSGCRTSEPFGLGSGHKTRYVVVCPSTGGKALHRGLFVVSVSSRTSCCGAPEGCVSKHERQGGCPPFETPRFAWLLRGRRGARLVSDRRTAPRFGALSPPRRRCAAPDGQAVDPARGSAARGTGSGTAGGISRHVSCAAAGPENRVTSPAIGPAKTDGMEAS
jgi:hypothetical protein